MKRLMAALLVLNLAVCSGCSAKKQVTVNTDEKNLTAMIHYKDTGYYCGIRFGKGEFLLTVYSPEELKGYKYICDADGERIEFEGLTYKTDACGFAGELKGAFELCRGKSAKKTADGFSFDTGNGKNSVTIWVNGKGYPIKLRCNKSGLTADFKE